jgi:hypothetical protein
MRVSRTVRIQHSLYPDAVIAVAAREFDRLCSVSLIADGDSSVVTIDQNDDAPDETIDEFLNFILCAALEYHLSG